MHYAVQSGNADLLQWLLKDCGLDATIPDGLGRTGTHIASSMGSLHMLQCLHANRQLSFSPDESSCYPLHLVARNGSVDCAKVLLACGHPPHATDAQGCGALHLACTEHNLSVIEVLAEASSVDGYDITGASPLMICVEKGMLDAIETLLKFGASAAHRDFFGRSCLHAALSMPPDVKQQTIATMLIKGGCDVNARDTMGRSPCFIAAEKGNIDMLKLLMDYGGDIAAADSSGKTCLALLGRDHFQVVTQLLIERLVPVSLREVRAISRSHCVPIVTLFSLICTLLSRMAMSCALRASFVVPAENVNDLVTYLILPRFLNHATSFFVAVHHTLFMYVHERMQLPVPPELNLHFEMIKVRLLKLWCVFVDALLFIISTPSVNPAHVPNSVRNTLCQERCAPAQLCLPHWQQRIARVLSQDGRQRDAGATCSCFVARRFRCHVTNLCSP